MWVRQRRAVCLLLSSLSRPGTQRVYSLGPGQHTQYAPIPLPGFNQTVKSVAPGQDHTLILTKTGEVYSWGLNRFSQLGYVVETATGVRSEEPIQATPRKISGAIRNRGVLGVAACKTASVCWTADEVFTWGTNNGQLGLYSAVSSVKLCLPAYMQGMTGRHILCNSSLGWLPRSPSL